MNIEEVLDDVARHLDFVYATDQFSIRDNEMKEMLIEISILRMENKKLQSIIKEVREYIGSKEHYEDDFDTEIEKVYKILDKENK